MRCWASDRVCHESPSLICLKASYNGLLCESLWVSFTRSGWTCRHDRCREASVHTAPYCLYLPPVTTTARFPLVFLGIVEIVRTLRMEVLFIAWAQGETSWFVLSFELLLIANLSRHVCMFVRLCRPLVKECLLCCCEQVKDLPSLCPSRRSPLHKPFSVLHCPWQPSGGWLSPMLCWACQKCAPKGWWGLSR